MSTKARWVGLLFVGILLAGAASAQDDQSDDQGGTRFYAEIGLWVAQAAGMEYEPAARINPIDPFDNQILRMDHGTQDRARYRFGANLGRRGGSFYVVWYAHEEDDLALEAYRPNDFIFGQLLSFPTYAGFSNDGLADGFDSDARTVLRDLRVDYYRNAFRSDRAVGDWFIGYREVDHKRRLNATYFGLEPLLPPFIEPFSPPRPDLDPLPESATIASEYNGRGLEAGFDLKLPILKSKKLEVEAGFLVAALRGDIDATYQSTNALYVINEGVEQVPLAPPYDEFAEVEELVPGTGIFTPVADRIEQIQELNGISIENRSASSSVIEANLGIRWHAWRGLDVFLGFRTARYDDVGVDLRIEEASSVPVGFNAQRVVETDRSAVYEGFYGGISYSF